MVTVYFHFRPFPKNLWATDFVLTVFLSSLTALVISPNACLNQINMEILLEVASFDGSEKQYDILPAVSPAEVAELWPAFSGEHDNMAVHSLVKCTFQGIVATHPLRHLFSYLNFNLMTLTSFDMSSRGQMLK